MLDLGKVVMKTDNLPMPPTVNKVYFTHGKSRSLTSAGKTYKEDVKAILIKQILETKIPDLKDKPLALWMVCYFEQVENKNTAKSRFKRIDVSNRIKVLEDAVVETLGIDDSQFMTVIAQKKQADTESVSIEIYDVERV